MNIQEFVSNFLTFLERREENLLSWGFYNIQFSETEMLNALESESPQEIQDQWKDIKSQGITFKKLVRELRQSHLIYSIPNAPDMYRTRMAEAIRLLANLRQLFRPEDWATGPRLVSDIKIHLKDRVYPRRNIPAMDIWNSSLKRICPPESKQLIQECYEALSQNEKGEIFKFSGFQQRSFEHLFKEYNSGNWSGSVICAGTGSGKTKAFYIPTFLRVAEEISNDSSLFTKVIAIYPRNVLLADQLREALSEGQKLNSVLVCHGHRPITFGALLGSSPWKSWFNPIPHGQRSPSWHWEKRTDGHVIPYLKSPVDGKSDLIWKQADRKIEKTSLYRLGESVPDVPDGILRITREQLMQNPPDVLFLSLEMLNREMGNPQWRKTFGIRQGEYSPRMVLLDEVHTYEGISGAQAAWVLRRWKYWMFSETKAKPPHFIGLSATLKEAPEHMGRMCGIYPDRITEFKPYPDVSSDGEMETKGQEYNLVLKGDPSSGTALLSTSIQTAMLLTRVMTPRNYFTPKPAPPIRAEAFYLRKAFGFTDNLDSLNRWFANMSDAERQRLSSLRSMPDPIPNLLVLRRMRDEGQLWELPYEIGHNLSQSLDVSRCSSQDPGANTNSDLILATSSLEVGFDDPQVGMILHHKAPTSMSSFIQRKGRAGRIRGSRPWTVVILSDYGRDRWAFQAAERLFNPEIDKIYLPIANPYVVRVQMALFLVDWLGQEINETESPFSYLSQPSTWGATRKAQSETKKYLEDFLFQGAQWKRFYHSAFLFYFYGRGGLFINNEEDKALATGELNQIFWEDPRPLLINAIPALLRKLEVDWKQMGVVNHFIEDKGANRPMPKSIPKATFEDLDLNEASIELEPYRGRHKDIESLSMPQFLRETCPGRVSKRFSTFANVAPPEPGYWHEISPTLQSGQNTLSLAQLYPENLSLTSVGNIQICCPLNAKLTHIPFDTIESSSSDWQWQTQANTRNDAYGNPLPIKGSMPWNQVFSKATAHLHIQGSWIELLRYACSCRFEIRRLKNNSAQGKLVLQTDDGNPEAVGFQVNTDGLRFELNNESLQQFLITSNKIIAQVRYEYFLYKLKSSPALQEFLNVFRADWMAQVSMAMLCATAIRNNLSLEKAQQLLVGKRVESAQRVLEIIFQVRGVNPTGQEEESRLQQDILALWQNPTVVSEIERLEAVLWENPGIDFGQWMRQRYLATLAQALRVAAVTVSDQVNEDDLVVDVIRDEEKSEILLTEKSSGGLGQIESIVREIQSDPRFFLDALEHSLSNCPRESWASNLNATVKCVHEEHRIGSGTLASAFDNIRNAQSLTLLEQGKKTLVDAMYDHGLNPHRSNISAVSMKLLRPGSSKTTDTLTFLVNESWHRHNQRIGLTIPIRTFAYLVSSYKPSQKRLKNLFKQTYQSEPSFTQLYAIIQQLLFEGCEDSCPDCLNNPNYFNDFGKPARNIALKWLSLSVTEVMVNSDSKDWMSKARQILENEGRVCLIAQMDTKNTLIEKLVPIFFEELNVQNFRESVYINKVERAGGYIRIILNIRDFINA